MESHVRYLFLVAGQRRGGLLISTQVAHARGRRHVRQLAMNGEHQLLVIDEPVEFEKITG